MTEFPVLQVQGLAVDSTIDGQTVIQGVDFELKPGEIMCLHGPSGSGKSSLALAIMGLLPEGLRASGGSVILGGSNLLALDPKALAGVRGKQVAMIFQDPLSSLNPVLRCGIQAEVPLTLHTTLTPESKRAAVLESFRQMRFDDPERIYGAFPAELSGGQRQRVMLAMATLLKPSVLIADEPTSALDSVSANFILDLMAKLSEEDRISILLITHDLEISRRISTRFLRMENGRMKKQAPLEQVKSTPSYGEPLRPPVDARVTVKSIYKTYRDKSTWLKSNNGMMVLDDVSLEIMPGEIVGIVGPSGSGKTTLGRCIAGLEKPDQGKVLLEGKPIQLRRMRGEPHAVQVVYQSPYSSLNPCMTVEEAIGEGLRWRLPSLAERQGQVEELLAAVGLPADYSTRLPAALSGGERQRVVIARCLAAEPRLLVADEPTASLDDPTRDQILDLFLELARKRKFSVMLISHDSEAVARICLRVYLLENGRITISARATSGKFA